jgi:hypothetical protein
MGYEEETATYQYPRRLEGKTALKEVNKVLPTRESNRTIPIKLDVKDFARSLAEIAVAAVAPSTVSNIKNELPSAVPNKIIDARHAPDAKDDFVDHRDYPQKHLPDIQLFAGGHLLKATASAVEVGTLSPSVGRIKIHAEIDADGRVNATIASSSSEGALALHTELPKLSKFLLSESVPVSSLNIHTMSGNSTDDGRQLGQGADSYDMHPKHESREPPVVGAERQLSRDEVVEDDHAYIEEPNAENDTRERLNIIV